MSRPEVRVGPGAEELAFTRDVLNLLADGGVDVSALEKKLNKDDDHFRTKSVLDLAEQLGKVCAYVNHEQLYSSLKGGYTYLQGRMVAIKKDMGRKIRAMEADNKANPETLENLRRNRELMDSFLALINVNATRVRLIRAQFENPLNEEDKGTALPVTSSTRRSKKPDKAERRTSQSRRTSVLPS